MSQKQYAAYCLSNIFLKRKEEQSVWGQWKRSEKQRNWVIHERLARHPGSRCGPSAISETVSCSLIGDAFPGTESNWVPAGLYRLPSMVFAVVVLSFYFGKLEMLGCALYAHPTAAIPMGKEQPPDILSPCALILFIYAFTQVSWPLYFKGWTGGTSDWLSSKFSSLANDSFKNDSTSICVDET